MALIMKKQVTSSPVSDPSKDKIYCETGDKVKISFVHEGEEYATEWELVETVGSMFYTLIRDIESKEEAKEAENDGVAGDVGVISILEPGNYIVLKVSGGSTPMVIKSAPDEVPSE